VSRNFIELKLKELRFREKWGRLGGIQGERNRRYRAHSIAYQYPDLVFLPALIATEWKANPHDMLLFPALRSFFDLLPYALLVAGCILYYTLPQAILFWTEPDLEAEG
jgi:hypothetical protein